MQRSLHGFTLIELVVVIAILGILASVAIPRFAALQTDARIAKVNTALGSLKAGAALARSVQLSRGLAANAAVDMEGVTIAMVNGYPSAGSIAAAAGIAGTEYAIGPLSSGANQIRIAADDGHPDCAVVYFEAGAGKAAGFSRLLDPSNADDRSNCS